jgi:hypothetical protein
MQDDLVSEYEKMAIGLQEHIRNYKPASWTVSIGNVAYAPIILPNDFKVFEKEHKKGNLKNWLSSSGNRELSQWYIQEAILDFFNGK